MSDVNGLDMLKEICAMGPSAKVLVYSGTGGGTMESKPVCWE